MKYRLFLLKRFVEDIFIWPFILLGRARADKYPQAEAYDIFFFFPFYHTGERRKCTRKSRRPFADGNAW